MSEPTERQLENLALARLAYELYNADDLKRQIELSAEEIEVHIPEDGGPTAGTYRGREGYRQWYRDWKDSFDEYHAEPLRMEPVGDRHVVALARQTAKGKGSGVPVEMDSGNLFEFRDGKMLALHLYGSWEEAMKAAEGRESARAKTSG